MASPFYLKNTIKNKSAERIVLEMFKEDSRYLVMAQSHDSVITELAALEKAEDIKKELLKIQDRPELSILDTRSGAYYMVKVKYRDNPTPQMLLAIAKEVSLDYPNMYMCLVTPMGFFFDSCKDIIKQEGDILLIDESIISAELQEKYLKILLDTVKQKETE